MMCEYLLMNNNNSFIYTSWFVLDKAGLACRLWIFINGYRRMEYTLSEFFSAKSCARRGAAQPAQSGRAPKFEIWLMSFIGAGLLMLIDSLILVNSSSKMCTFDLECSLRMYYSFRIVFNDICLWAWWEAEESTYMRKLKTLSRA